MTAIYWHLDPCASWVEDGTSTFLSFDYGGTVRTSLQLVYLNTHEQFNLQDTHPVLYFEKRRAVHGDLVV